MIAYLFTILLPLLYIIFAFSIYIAVNFGNKSGWTYVFLALSTGHILDKIIPNKNLMLILSFILHTIALGLIGLPLDYLLSLV